MGLSCAFTGHRDMYESIVDKLLVEIEKLIDKGVSTFYCGMARGFDLKAGDCVCLLKEFHPEIKLIAVVPCRDQASKFSYMDKVAYEQLLKRCDEVIVLHEKYCAGCMFERNRYMVDRSDYVMAYLRKSTGGTKFTVNYALSTHKQVVIV